MRDGFNPNDFSKSYEFPPLLNSSSSLGVANSLGRKETKAGMAIKNLRESSVRQGLGNPSIDRRGSKQKGSLRVGPKTIEE